MASQNLLYNKSFIAQLVGMVSGRPGFNSTSHLFCKNAFSISSAFLNYAMILDSVPLHDTFSMALQPDSR